MIEAMKLIHGWFFNELGYNRLIGNLAFEDTRSRDLMSKGGGYILSPAQEIQGDVPAENILALIETAKEIYKPTNRTDR